MLDDYYGRAILVRVEQIFRSLEVMATNEDRISADADQIVSLLTSTLAELSDVQSQLAAAQANADDDTTLSPIADKLDSIVSKLQAVQPAPAPVSAPVASTTAAPASDTAAPADGDTPAAA